MSRSHSVDLQLFLNRLTARSALSRVEQEAILAIPTHPIEVCAQRDLVRENEGSGYGYFVVSGLVGGFAQTGDGLRQITQLYIPGDMANLDSVVRPQRIGGLTALCDSIVVQVPHSAIRAVAARYPAVAEAFWRDCMLDLAILKQWIVNVGRRSARTRLAHIFCEMAVRFGGGRTILKDYHLPLTQVQLGDAAAITSVHVNRSLMWLNREGLVTAVRGRVQIHDWDRLVEVAEFDPAYLVADTSPQQQQRLLAVD